MCGATVLQFSTPSDITTSFTGSSLLFLQTIVVAGASVYNQKIYQRSDGNFHAMNISLFGYSAILHAILYVASYVGGEYAVISTEKDLAVLAVAVISNVSVGLASAFVLKCESQSGLSLLERLTDCLLPDNDALVMYFVLSLSTGFLLCFEQFFTASISLLAIPGAGVILLATYQYFIASTIPETEPSSPLESARIQLTPPNTSHLARYLKTPLGLALTTILAIALSVPLNKYQFSTAHPVTAMPNEQVINQSFDDIVPVIQDVVTSPFKNTIAFIRVNHDLPQREQLVRDAYSPFFHTVHVSMPSDEKKHGNHAITETTPERDYWNDGFLPYPPVRELLNLLLEQEQADAQSNITSEKGSIEGILYFHFDAWVEPLSFQNMPMDNIWALNSGDMLKYKCMRGDPYREPGVSSFFPPSMAYFIRFVPRLQRKHIATTN